MAIAHRDHDSRSCGATTTVVGQNFVKVDGQLWAVAGDTETHGGGQLNNTQTYIKINGIYACLVGDGASADNLCIPLGGQHCAPLASSGDSLINVS